MLDRIGPGPETNGVLRFPDLSLPRSMRADSAGHRVILTEFLPSLPGNSLLPDLCYKMLFLWVNHVGIE